MTTYRWLDEEGVARSDSHIMSDRLVLLAAQRDRDIRTLPTIAEKHDIDEAIAALPDTLPEQGYGTEKALNLVHDKILPALAAGQAGPRCAASHNKARRTPTYSYRIKILWICRWGYSASRA